jgi:hypothetical protein
MMAGMAGMAGMARMAGTHGHRTIGIALAVLAVWAAGCVPVTRSSTPVQPHALQPNTAEGDAMRSGPLAYDGPGAELIGRDVRALLPTRFVGADAGYTGQATLVRWWTDNCPFCERSLPAVEGLRTRHAPRGLRTVAIYHPKPPRAVDDAFVKSAAERLGYHGAIAVDERWDALNRIWLETGSREATSVSFLLDATGRIRWVHPGPDLHPSGDPAFAGPNADYARMDAAIAKLLAE